MARIPAALQWLLVALVLAAGLLLPRWLGSRSGEPASAEATAAPVKIPVRVEAMRPRLLEERLTATGTVLANERVEVVSEIAGKVEKIHFREGAPVEEGEVLVELDTSTLVAERDRARYRYELIQKQEARQRRLLDDGLLSQEEYEFTVGELNVLGAELELRQAILEKARIRAPFPGIVGLRAVSVGSYLSSQTRVTTLQDIDPVKVEFAVPESYARDLAVGDAIRFSVQGVEKPFTGEVFALEPAFDPATRSLTLRARASNPGRLLFPGAFAEVELAVRQVEDALSVPAMAVIPELGGRKVFVLEDGRAVSRLVETGIRTEERVQIVGGLEPGERVIVSNIARLAEGVEVEVADSPGEGDPS